MATKGERQALIFLAAVALLGAGARVYRARHVGVASAGLDGQIAAVDSAKAGSQVASRGSRGQRRSAKPQPVARSLQPRPPIDLDTAPVEEIETLPGIGPALASRIVNDRASNGPFGCIAALDSVKGIGPALLKRLDSLITFSAAGRAACLRGEAVVAARSGRGERGLSRR